ncbi:MAG: S8 family serine peptidase [Thermomicrobiales bacterium]
MHRARHLLLTALVILGLLLSPWPSSPAAPALATADQGPAGDAAANQHVPRAKKHKKRQKARKQRERKQDRKHDRKQNNRQRKKQPVKLDTGVLPAADEASPTLPDGTPSVQDSYIVRLKPAAESPLRSARTMSRDFEGVTPTHVYSHVFDGFAAVIPADKLDDVRNDPRVAAVVPDMLVYTTAQTIPTGIRRIDADENPIADIDGTDEPVDVDVALVDSAGKGTHEDLNIYAWANCTASHENSDDHGHGTFVAGVIGAKDNGVGVVGVAPGARLWAIRSLISNGQGAGVGKTSWIICGLDLIKEHATPQADGLGDIEVANFSITSAFVDTSVCGPGQEGLYHQAYCDVVDAGVTVVAGAANSDADAAGFVPASYDEVITVSALADSNGQGGAPGPDTSKGPDESLATFSNWGADVDIAAPGVDILSTVPTGDCEFCTPSGYQIASGTSVSTPYVSGAAALYLSTHPGASPAQVKTAILDAREDVTLPNDPDGIDEGVLRVGADFG